MTDSNTPVIAWKPLPEMSDREIAEETLTHLRSIAEAIAELQDTPMMRAMRSGGNPLMAMMRG